MAGVSVSGLCKSYGKVDVIKEVSFSAPDGAFVALIGPSGCGKSTLLRCIAGLEGVQGGTISIGDRIVNDIEPKERDAAMVFQNYALYPHMTVRQNMAFSLKLRGGDKNEINARVNEAAAILGLMDYLDRYPRQLSGGQRQRVAMGRAIVRKPSVFLFDEPLSNLDAALRVQMRAEIRGLHKRLGVTSIYVTHDQVEAMTMADQVVVLRDGVIEQVGPPLELYDRPNSVFVATFIGSPAMNILAGEIIKGKFVTHDGQNLALPSRLSASHGAQVKLGIRPEHLVVSLPDTANGIHAKVESIESTGSATYLSFAAGMANISVVASERLALDVGHVATLTFDQKHMHLFDAATGRRIG